MTAARPVVGGCATLPTQDLGCVTCYVRTVELTMLGCNSSAGAAAASIPACLRLLPAFLQP